MRRSKSFFKVINFDINRKPAVNNINSRPLSHRLPVIAHYSIYQIIAFNKGVPLVNALILSNLFEYRHKS